MNANLRICEVGAYEATPDVNNRFEQLRLKLIRETERYLSNPYAESWARLDSSWPNRTATDYVELTAA